MADNNNFSVKVEAELDDRKLKNDLNNLNKNPVKVKVDTGDSKSQIDNINSSIQTATKSTHSFWDAIKSAFNFSSAYAITSQGINAVRQALKGATDAVKDYDDAIKDLRMATGGTYEETAQLTKEYNALGKQVGATTKEVTSGADSWLRQGHNIKQTNTLVKDSIMLSKIANIESADSTKYLTSAMKGYKVESENVLNIVDKLTAVDLVSATDAGGLAEAMSRTAVTANDFGVTMDKLLGYLAVMGETTQKDMSSVGEAAKTFFSRMAQIKAGKLELVDADGTTELLSDVEVTLKNAGIDLRKTLTEYNSAGDVLDNLASKWDSLNQSQQNAIVQALGGTRQQEMVRALLANYGTASKYMEIAVNSAGTAENKFSAYLDSIEAKTKSLQASFESLAINSVSTETVSGIIEASGALLDFLNKTNLVKSSLAGLAAGALVKGFTMIATSVKCAALKLNDFNSALKLVKIGNIGTEEINRLAQMTANLSDSQKKAVLSSKNLSAEQRIQILTAQGMSEADAKAALANMGLATSEGVASGATFTLTGALKGLWATLMANPITAIVLAVTAVATIFSTIKQKAEEARQKLEEQRRETIETANNAATLGKEISDLTTDFINLSEAVKTDENAKSQLLDTQNQLIEKLGIEKGELDDLIKKYGSLSDAIKQASIEKLKEAERDLRGGVNSSKDSLIDKAKVEYENVLGSGAVAPLPNLVSTYGTSKQNIVDGTASYKAIQALQNSDLFNAWSENKAFSFSIKGMTLDDLKTIEGIVKAYNQLGKALDIVSDAAGSENEVYKNLYEQYLKVKEEIEGYENAIGNLNDNLAEQEVLNNLIGQEIPTTADAFNSFKQKVIESATESGNFVGSQKDVENAIDGVLSKQTQFAKFYDTISEKTEKATDTQKDFADTLSGVQSLSGGLNQLDKIYADIFDKGDFDFSSILNNDKFNEAFSGLGESYTNFIKTVANSPSDLKACQGAFNDLASAYIENSGVLDNLTDETRDATIAMLEQMGVANAAAIVDNELAYAKEKAKYNTAYYTDMTYDEIMALYNECKAGTTTKQVLAELASEKLRINNNAIRTSSDIEQLISLANTANATTASLQRLSQAKSLISQAEAYEKQKADLIAKGADPRGISVVSTNASNYRQWAEDLLKNPLDYNKLDSNSFKADYKGGSAYKSAVDKANKANKSKDKADNQKPEAFDFIEIALKRIEKSVSRLKNIATSAYKSLSTKLKATSGELNTINEQIKTQEQAYNRYIKQANSVGLSSSLAEKVRNGAIDIQLYDKETQELIKNYQEWFNKAVDCKDAIDELHESLASLYEDKFNAVNSTYSNKIELLGHLSNSYNNGLDLLQAQGYVDSTVYYDALIAVENQKSSVLKEELAELTTAFSDAMNSGEIEEFSESWFKMQQNINDVTEAISQSNIELNKYAKTMREIEESYFEFTQDRISQITEESNFLIDLMSNEELLSDDGQLTDKGKATVGLHGQNYNVYMSQADQYAQEIENLNKELSKDPYNTELIAHREELLKLQQESIIAAEEEKKAVVDLVENGIEKELSSLKELIDNYIEALDNIKDFSDYQDKVAEKAKEIASLQKQLSAYQNDNSEETKAKVQKLQVDLAEAQKDLDKTEYEQFITDQKKLLNELHTEYTEFINQRLDDTNSLIIDMIDTTNANTETINSTLHEVSDNVGYTMSDNMQRIWDGSTGAINGTITKYGDSFSNQLTSVNIVLNGIQATVASMVKESDKKAETTVKNTKTTTTPAKSAPASKPASKPATTPKTTEKKVTVGGKINAGGAKIYADSSGGGKQNQYYAKDPIYTVIGENNGYWKVRYHKLSKGVTGWFKKSDVKAYKTGGLVDYTGLAQVDGTPGKPELMLNANDTENFLQLRDYLRKISSQPLIDKSLINTPNIAMIHDLSKAAEGVKQSGNSKNTDQSNVFNTTIEIDKVVDYNDLVNKMRDDKNFEKMIHAMTVDRLVGGGSLAKYRYSW